MNRTITFSGIVAISAGVALGAAITLCYKLEQHRQEELRLQQEVALLHREVDNLRRMLSSLKKRLLRRATVTDTDTDDMETAAGDSDEFYDVSEAETGSIPDVDTAIHVQDVLHPSPFQEIDSLLDANSIEEKKTAYGMLLGLLEKNGPSVDIHWRLAKACHLIGYFLNTNLDDEQFKEYYIKGVEYGERAITEDKSCWQAHKWYAMCVGNRGKLGSTKDKLKDGLIFKQHVDIALSLKPDDPLLHHLLGRFHFEVASLTWVEKKAASVLFGKVPDCTMAQALASLQTAQDLYKEPWKTNQLLMAQCHFAEKNYTEGLKLLDLARVVPALSVEEKASDDKIDGLLKRYSSYRTQS